MYSSVLFYPTKLLRKTRAGTCKTDGSTSAGRLIASIGGIKKGAASVSDCRFLSPLLSVVSMN